MTRNMQEQHNRQVSCSHLHGKSHIFSHLNQTQKYHYLRRESCQVIEMLIMPPALSIMETSKSTTHHQHCSTSWSSRFGLFRCGQLSPPQKNRKRRAIKRCRRAVSFASHVELFEIPSNSDEDLLHAAWIQKADLKRIRAECMVTVRKWNNGELLEGDEEYTMRGLETKSTSATAADGQRRARLRKFDSHRAVFDEQQFQSEEGSSDADSIALFYSDVANSARVIALLRGYNDEQEVRKMHSNAER